MGIMVGANLPNRTPASWYTNVRAGRPGYPGYTQAGGSVGGGWVTAPSGGAPLPGVTLQRIPRYKTWGFGSNMGG